VPVPPLSEGSAASGLGARRRPLLVEADFARVYLFAYPQRVRLLLYEDMPAGLVSEALVWPLVLRNLAVALLAKLVGLLSERLALLCLLLPPVLAHPEGGRDRAGVRAGWRREEKNKCGFIQDDKMRICT